MRIITTSPGTMGIVSLVGAGPGDPELITVKGLDRLRRADVVVYDRLIPTALLREVRPDAELVDAGKAPGRQAMTQPEIHALLIDRARAGRRVVRLKGGDPSIFGRAGEELDALRRARVPVEIVPGVTAAVAAAAAAGISLTHRELASTVILTTGTEASAKEGSSLPWRDLGQVEGTLVFYMPIREMERLTRTLVALGRDPDEAALVVQDASTGRQRLVAGRLGEIARQAREQGIGSPAVLISGPTVSQCPEWRKAARRVGSAVLTR